MSTTTELVQTETSTLPDDATGPDFTELTLSHRCDACSAAAVAQVEIDDDSAHLLFCGHHWRKNMGAIKALGYVYEVDDEHDYLFTDREILARPRDNSARDGGSA